MWWCPKFLQGIRGVIHGSIKFAMVPQIRVRYFSTRYGYTILWKGPRSHQVFLIANTSPWKSWKVPHSRWIFLEVEIEFIRVTKTSTDFPRWWPWGSRGLTGTKMSPLFPRCIPHPGHRRSISQAHQMPAKASSNARRGLKNIIKTKTSRTLLQGQVY